MKKLFYQCFSILISISASAQIISQYIETESGTSPKGIEIWNNTASTLDFSIDNLVIEKGEFSLVSDMFLFEVYFKMSLISSTFKSDNIN